MKVILLKDVRNVGRRFEVKDVSDGYAMNSLIPHGLAQIANGTALKGIEEKKRQEEEARQLRADELAKNIGKIENITLQIKGKANDKGHLFAGIHTEELVKELASQAGLNIDAEFIELDKPLKEIGEHKVAVKVGEKRANFTVHVESK